MDIQQMDPRQLLSQSVPEDCKNCGGMMFKQSFMFRRISKILIGATQDQLVPIPVFRCDDCGSPIGDMVPNDDEQDNDDTQDNIIKMH